MRIPPSLCPFRNMSLGHFSLTGNPVSSSSACLVAFAVRNFSSGSLEATTLGLRSTENQRPPLGDSHLFPLLPLPLVWRSATTTVHSGDPFSPRSYSVVLVDWSCL